MATLGVILTDSQARRLIGKHGQADAGSLGEVQDIPVSSLGLILRDPEFKRHLRASMTDLHDPSGPKHAFLVNANAVADEEGADWDRVAQSSNREWKEALLSAPVWHAEFLGHEVEEHAPAHSESDQEEQKGGTEEDAEELPSSGVVRRSLMMAPDEKEVKRELSLPPQLDIDIVGQGLGEDGQPEDEEDERDDFEDMQRGRLRGGPVPLP